MVDSLGLVAAEPSAPSDRRSSLLSLARPVALAAVKLGHRPGVDWVERSGADSAALRLDGGGSGCALGGAVCCRHGPGAAGSLHRLASQAGTPAWRLARLVCARLGQTFAARLSLADRRLRHLSVFAA